MDNEILGTEENPIHNNQELSKAIIGKNNCCLYTVGTFKVNEENLYQLEKRKIKLIGLMVAMALGRKNGKNFNVNQIKQEIDKFISIGIDVNLTQKSKQINKYISGMK